MLLAILIVRSDRLEAVPALSTIAASLFLAVAAVILSVAALVVIWIDGVDGLGQALTAILIGVLMLAYPAYLTVKAYRLPAINDITTDPIDPPRFEVIAKLRQRDANPVTYAGLRTAELQREAYRDIEPLQLSNPPQEAFDAAYAVITRRKWRIVDARPPQARRDGLIEAVARSPIMGFRDDVVVRIRSGQDGVRIDARSASRYGHHDFGDNASRIRNLLEDIDDFAGSDAAKKLTAKAAKNQQTPATKNAHTPVRR
jgi:uncharacterized protein (DUF1499 family)